MHDLSWRGRLKRLVRGYRPPEISSWKTQKYMRGDLVTVDVTVMKGSHKVEQDSRADYLYTVGSGEVREKLDVELVGTKPGAILKVADTLPERFGEELGGAPVDISVIVKDVKARRLPEVDDEFAKTASEFDTIPQLRDDLRTRLTEVKEREATAALRDLALQAMIEKVDVDLPDSLIEEETDHRVHHARDQAERMGIGLEKMLELQGWDEARLREDSRQHAIRAIKSDLVLEGIARSASLDVTAEEIGAEIAVLAQAYGREPKAVAKDLAALVYDEAFWQDGLTVGRAIPRIPQPLST